ncbi:helix-turn-helix domain-containing protein [Enterococcus durans]|uniref:helix-turn-helix domain-containing protein n=1 Tax=Enterococcus durans TaxID=53345 RepID=UPI00356AEC1E
MKKLHGFPNEYLYVLPNEVLNNFKFSKIIRELYITDIGYYPNAKEHYVYREFGAKEWMMIFCTHGRGVVKSKDKEWSISRGSVVLMPPDQEHTYYSDEGNPWDIFWVHFTGKEVVGYLPQSLQAKDEFMVKQLCHSKEMNRLMFYFGGMIQTFSSGFSYEALLYASQLLRTILSYLAFHETENSAASNKGNEYVTQAIQYIYDHLEEKIIVEDIAQTLMISPNYLSKIFRQVMGISVNYFITNVKTKQASHYLLNTTLSVQQIAQYLGYQDQYYFSRLFKKIYGVPPKKFREQRGPKNGKESSIE